MDLFLNRTKKIIFSKQQGIFSSAIILSGMIVISRIFGFFRYRILSSFFIKEELDIYFAAFRIPDLIFEILITGAITATFIPIFIKYKKDKKILNNNISTIINLITLILFVFIIIIFLTVDKIIPLITPGFSDQAISQVIFFTKILLIGQLPFLILGNFLIGIGQANKRFFLSAFAPIIYNLSIIVITLMFSNQLSLTAPIIGVIIGAFLFSLSQLPMLFKSQFQYKLIIKKTKELSEFFKLVIPRILNVFAGQIEATIDLTLASLVGPGSYAIFYLAQRLQLLPVSVIGISFGQASLPYLSEMHQEKKIIAFKKVIIDSVLSLFFFSIPIMSLFIFARTPIVRLFFGGHKFDWEATVQTAKTVSYFSLGLPFHTLYYFLIRAYYAVLDSKTPFFISLTSIIINSILSILFIIVFHFPIWFLGLSFSISMFVNFVFLFFLLSKKLGGLDFFTFFLESIKMSIATILSTVPAYYGMKLLDGLVFDTTRTINVFFLLLITSILFFSLYLFISWFINVKEIYLIAKLMIKAKEYKRKIIEVYTSVK